MLIKGTFHTPDIDGAVTHSIAIQAIILAEQEAEELHAEELQELREECERWRIAENESRQREQLAVNLANEKRKYAENIKDKAVEAFCSWCQCYNVCPTKKCENLDLFTQNLTK